MNKVLANIKAHKWTYLIVLIAAAVCCYLLRITYAALILCYIGIYAIAANGLDLVWGYTGQISYGHAGFYAIGAYTTALLSTRLGITPILALVIGSVLSAAVGVLVAFPAAKLVKHFLALMTLSFGQMIYMFVNSAKDITGGSAGVKQIPNISLFGLEMDTNQKLFILVIVILAITMFVKYSIIHSRTGRAFIAIRENTHAANGIGISPVKYKVMAFALSAFFTGTAGGLYACMVNYISPETFQSMQSVVFMTILLFGGIGSFLGPLIGSVIVVLIKELFQVFSQYQQLLYAVFILLVLFCLPTGLVGLIDIVKNKLKKLGKKKQIADSTKNKEDGRNADA